MIRQRQVLPSLTPNGQYNGVRRQAEFARHRRTRLSFGVPLPEFDYLGIGHRCVLMLLSLIPAAAALGEHVAHIVCTRAKKEVVRSAARWIVALVEHPQAIGNRAVGKFPSNAVALLGVAFMRAVRHLDGAVAVMIRAASPHPAWPQVGSYNGTVLVDVRPETLGQGSTRHGRTRFTPTLFTAMGCPAILQAVRVRPEGLTANIADKFNRWASTNAARFCGTIILHGEPPIQVSCVTGRDVDSIAVPLSRPILPHLSASFKPSLHFFGGHP